MPHIQKLIQWFTDREGKVSYSMTHRNGPHSYDCSSAVYSALIHAGVLPAGTRLGNTETLYSLEDVIFRPIKRQDIRTGDLFVSGHKGRSLGAGGHTGVVLNAQTIIHCTYTRRGIARTPIDGWTAAAGHPTHWYRIILSNSSKTDPPSIARPAKTSPFKALAVGDAVTIRPGMSHWQTGEAPNFNVIGFKDRILQVKTVAQSKSQRAYLLEHLYSWILEQDLEEAYK